jgi:hypothetical protein
MPREVKYSEQDERFMAETYDPLASEAERDEAVEIIMRKLDKTKRMIVAKLSKMDLYVKKSRVSKVTGKSPETKEQMIRRLETKLGWPPGDFEGLEKAPKIVIQKLLEEYKS